MEITTLYEKIDKRRIKWLLEQDTIHEKEDEKNKAILKSMLKAMKNDDRLEVVYKTGKEFKNDNYGRIFGYHNKKVYGCLGSLPRNIRGYLADSDYIDIDIKRCHWYIIKYLINKMELYDKYINKFINEYDVIIKKVIGAKLFDKEKYCSYNSEADMAKSSVFALLNSQKTIFSNESKEIIKLDDTLNKLHNQIYKVLLPSLKEEYKEIVEIINKSFKKNESNKDGKILSHILQHLERNIVINIVDFFNNKNFRIGTIIHDGFLMYKNNKFSDDLLEECEKYIKELYKGLEIKLVIKPFTKGDIPEPNEYFTGEDNEETVYSILCNKVINYVSDNKLRKDTDGNIYKRSKKNGLHYEMIYGIDGYKDLIEDVFEGDRLFNSNPANYQNMVNFILNRNMKEFRNIKSDLDLIGFNNCVLNIRTLEIIELDNISDEDDRIVRNYIDNRLDINRLNTTRFDEILKYQIGDEEAIKWYYILFGRLFFAPGNDGLQVMMLIKGFNNTGKSLAGNIMGASFKMGTVGTISSNQEQTFGLQSFLDKEIIIAMDLPEDMKNIISVDLFKAMSSGEAVNIPQKNKKAITMKWNIPNVFISNYYPNYEDKGGAISKRMAIFEFMKVVEEPDTTVLQYILDNELPSIIYKACKMYKEFIESNVNKTFNDIRPEYFVKTNEEYSRSNNPLYQFLTKPDSKDNDGNIYKIEYNDNYETTFVEIQNQYKNWCKYNNIKNNKIKADDSTFIMMKLKKIVKNICKSCNGEHTKGCCESFNRINKTTKVIIKGIRFVRENREETNWLDENMIEDDL